VPTAPKIGRFGRVGVLRRMNILQIVSSSRTSGAEKHVIVLSERLQKRGHQVTALCPPGGWLPERLRAAGVDVVERRMHGGQFLPAVMSVARSSRRQRYDLIHTHLTCATYLGFMAGLVNRLPVVTSVHVLTHDLVYRRLFPRKRNRIVTVSDFVRDSLVSQGIPAQGVQTIYNGTEFCADSVGEYSASFENDVLPVRAELSLPPQAELIGLFARVDEFKGHPVLVESMRRIVDARPNTYFVCVGAVEPAMQKSLWERAAQDGVAERMRFTGVRDDVQRLLGAMDVVTLPSRYEMCSMSIIEAMAMGKPVVATRAGGNPELIADGETGLLIERNPDALANALISLLSNPSRRAAMGTAARKRAESQFSANVMVERIESLYRELTAAPLSA
jgi:glycosyltransferase involved in cell wall biosynthesis